MIDVSIIIVNWNTKQLLKECLESVYKFTKDITFETIVVDNASTDGSVEMVENEFPNVRLIKNSENLGFAKANNIGIRAANGRNIFLLNSDTVLINNSIKILLEFVESSDKIGACGGKLLYPDGKLQHSYGYFPTFGRVIWITLAGILRIDFNKKPLGVIPYNIDKPIQVDYIVGADLMIKKTVLDKIGLLDESFFAYFEETDLCYRIRNAGYEVWYTPESEIIHVYGGSFAKFSSVKFKIFTTSQFKYFKKNLGYYKPYKYYLLAKMKGNMMFYFFKDKEKYNELKEMYNIIKSITV